MPIKDPTIYPPEWKAFSCFIRYERAELRCECTGECGREHQTIIYGLGTVVSERCTAMNGETGKIGRDGIWRNIDEMHGLNSDVGESLYNDEDIFGSKVVLTVAHLDADGGPCQCKATTGKKCATAEHVKGMCQACHLRYDMPHHQRNRAEGIAARKDESRGLLNICEFPGHVI